MNEGGTACCATEKANYCLPANSVDDGLDVGWQVGSCRGCRHAMPLLLAVTCTSYESSGLGA